MDGDRFGNKTVRVIFLAAALAAAVFCLAASLRFSSAYGAETAEAARAFGVDESLIRAIIFAESGYDNGAVSPAGASGLMQLMPITRAETSERTGIAADGSPRSEIMLGTAYFAALLRRFGDERAALAAYNAGPANARRWLESGEEPFPETAAYIRRVLFARKVYERVFIF